MKRSAGAPASICLASTALEAYDARMATPVSFRMSGFIASIAFVRLAAAKMRTSSAAAVGAASPLATAIVTRNALDTRPTHFQSMPPIMHALPRIDQWTEREGRERRGRRQHERMLPAGEACKGQLTCSSIA